MRGFGTVISHVTESTLVVWGQVGSRCRIVLVACAFCCFHLSSCTLATVSQSVVRETTVAILEDDTGLVCSPSGEVPYQKWRIPPWHEDLRYVWMVGNYDFRKRDSLELILYFHGMHATDYYRAFRTELELLAEKRPDRPFLFVGFVDTPYVASESRHQNRWRLLVPAPGESPEPLFKIVNRMFKALKKSFPHIAKDRTTITLAGFSGGGRVLDAVGGWLARSPDDDPFARVFRSRLTKIAYFDCWFDSDMLETVPALLRDNPGMRIVGTVYMDKPKKNADMLADKLKMKKLKNEETLIGLGGRLKILRDKSHWNAMISRLKEAL